MQPPVRSRAQAAGFRVPTRGPALRSVGQAAMALAIVSSVFPFTPALAASLPPAPAATVINQPPKPAAPGATLSVFPNRDFVTSIASAANVSGYPNGSYTINVIRNGIVIG